MTDSAPDPEAGGVASDSGRRSTTGMPRSVKVSLIVVVGLIGLFVVLHFAGVGMVHGPGRHMGGDHDASRVAEGAVRIAVKADDFTFDPDEFAVAAGEDVAIVLT